MRRRRRRRREPQSCHRPVRLVLPRPATLLLPLPILARLTPLIPFRVGAHGRTHANIGTAAAAATSVVLHQVGRGVDMVLVEPLPNVGGGPEGLLLERVPRGDGVKLLPVPAGRRAVEATRVPGRPRRAHPPVLHIEGRVVGPRRRSGLPPIHSWNGQRDRARG